MKRARPPQPGTEGRRAFALVERGKSPIVGDDRCLTLSFSSEQPVERWFGDEVLSHDAGAADFSRLNDSAPLLWNHDWDRIIGVVEKAWIEGRRGMATVRIAKSADGDEFLALLNDGVVRNVSFAYQVNAYQAPGSPDDDGDVVYTATKWMAYEISLVSVPADQTVGVGRSQPKRGSKMEEGNNEATTRAARQRLQGYTSGREEGSRVGAQAERERITELRAWGRKLGLEREADEAIADGLTVDEALAQFRRHMPDATPVAAISGTGHIGMTNREVRGFSFVRAIRAQMTNDWRDAGFERAACDAARKQLKPNALGVIIPQDVLYSRPDERAVYQVGTAGQGGNLVATNLLAGSFIEILRNASVTGQLGAQYLTGLVGKVAIPRRNAATAAFWVAESGAVTEAEATFDQVLLSPKTVGGLSKMSRLTLLQTTPDIEMLTRSDLVEVLGLAIDLAAISGTGASNQPTGIVNTAGTGSVVGGTNGANVTFDNMISMAAQTQIANAPQQNLGYAINAKVRGYLASQKATTGQYLWSPSGSIANGPAATLNGYKWAQSNQLRSNLTKGASSGICSEIVFGNWSELLIGEWGTIEILVNPFDSTGFANGDVVIRALQTIDIGVRHAASFSAMSDALTPGF